VKLRIIQKEVESLPSKRESFSKSESFLSRIKINCNEALEIVLIRINNVDCEFVRN